MRIGLTLVSRVVGATVEGGNAIGRSGNAEAAITLGKDAAQQIADGGERAIDAIVGFLSADLVPIANVLKASGGWRLDVGVRAIRGSDVVMKAVANEFGTRHVPERSFIRATLDRNRDAYMEMLEEALDRGLDGDDLEREMARIGAVVVGDIQRYMTELREPPNAPSTVRAKGSANPLIDTGQLRRAIDFRVVRPEED